MSSSIPLNPNPLYYSNKSQLSSTNYNVNVNSTVQLLNPRNPFHPTLSTKSHICFAFSSSSSNNHDEREEARWLREEQRWLREEQRWLREEQRWKAERQRLVAEIELLKGRKEVKKELSVLEVVETTKEVNRIAERGTGAVPFVVETVAEEVVRVSSDNKEKEKKGRAMLRKGSEGDEVKLMQEALQKLGFYCGDEDTEYSMFSSGTERAIKTWQATLHLPEDGVMTAELLDKLFMEQNCPQSTVKVDIERNNAAVLQKEVSNGAAVNSITEISEIQQHVIKEEVDLNHHRVFLLGENRWEDPSRLVNQNKKVGGGTNRDATTKCISCRGEGRLLCTECDGTGEPNIEEQFMEWVDEGAKCPYCDGLGYAKCDVCDGKTVY